jgi:AraC-like DNA-binding protein
MNSLSSIFRHKLIPWAKRDLEQRLVVARPKMTKRDVPYGVELSEKKITGKRIIVRKRESGHERLVHARWPESKIHDLYVSKLVCVLNGATDYRAGNYIVHCDEGHFILLPPYTTNTYGSPHLEGENRQHGSCDIVQLMLFRDYIQCLACSCRGEKYWDWFDCNTIAITNPQAVHLLKSFVQEAVAAKSDKDLLLSPILTAAFVLSLRDINDNAMKISPRPVKSTSDSDFVQQIYDYLKIDLSQSPTIEKAAQAMYMSPTQFTRQVRQKTGKSFLQLLTEYRIEEAKRLLRGNDWSMEAIARHIGFRSAPHFMTLFSEKVGCPPGKYRQKEK